MNCGAFEAAAVVDGATRSHTALFTTLADRIESAVDRVGRELGPGVQDAVERGAQMTDDELVGYLGAVVATLPD